MTRNKYFIYIDVQYILLGITLLCYSSNNITTIAHGISKQGNALTIKAIILL